MRTIPTFAFGLSLGLALGSAAAPARADDARRLELAKRLVAQIHLVDAMKSALPLMAAQMRKTLFAQGRTDGDTDDFVRLYEERVGADMGRYADAMAEAYAGLFTEDDLSDIIAFDDTPLGRRLIDAQPRVLQASAVATQVLAREAAEEAIAELDRRKANNAAPGTL